MFGRKKKLRATIATYEEALRRIAGKPQELERLQRVGIEPVDDADRAYRKCARIALIALWTHHPEMRTQQLLEIETKLAYQRDSTAGD